MKPLSPADLEWYYTRNGDDEGVLLLTISGSDVPELNIRLVNYPEEVTSRGLVFEPSYFEAVLPVASDERPVAKLRMLNARNVISNGLEDVKSELFLKFEMVRLSVPDRVIPNTTYSRLRASNFVYDQLQATAVMEVMDLDREPYRPLRMEAAHFPWLNYL